MAALSIGGGWQIMRHARAELRRPRIVATSTAA
jgi:hypothetical protein